MKARVATENLKRALALVGKAANNRTSLPILANVMLEAGTDGLALKTTNLEIGIIARIPALEVGEGGATTVPCKTLADLVGTLPNDALDLAVGKAETLRLTSNGTKSDIKGIAADEFPPMPAGWETSIPVPSADLREAIKQVVMCASTDEARPVLTGVHITLDKGKLSLRAADGFRMAMTSIDLPGAANPGKPLSLLVPARALDEVVKVASLCDTMRIATTSKRGLVGFTSECADVVSQLIEGNYPDLDQIVPHIYATRVEVNTKALLNAVKQADIFAREGSHVVKLVIQADTGEPRSVWVSGEGAETGNSESQVEAVVEGTPIAIGFNAQFLMEMLSAVTAPAVVMETTFDSSPGLFYPAGETATKFVIMPMHIGG